MTIPGLRYPQVQSYTPGAGNPAQSAFMATQNGADKQARLNAIGGRRRRRHRRSLRGGDSMPATVPVPQFSQPGATQANAQITGLSQSGMAQAENSKYDQLAMKKGGSKRRRRGGNPDWHWPCSSGGTRRRKTRKSKRRRSRRL